jgi:Na+/proline symporter
MGLYTGPWRTSISLGVTAMLGGIFVGLAFLPHASRGLRFGLIAGSVLWIAFFVGAFGSEIARHWQDREEDD